MSDDIHGSAITFCSFQQLAGIAVATRYWLATMRVDGLRSHGPEEVITTYRILIVDDDEDARILLARVIGRSALPIEIFTASDGVQALEVIARTRPHAVITDVMMPRMNGFDLCEAMRANPATASIPVVMLTALQDDMDRRWGMAAGATVFLTKPFARGELTAHLLNLLASRNDAPSPSI